MRLFRLFLGLIGVVLFAQVTLAQQMTCRWNGSNYQPFNAYDNVYIGKPGYGFSDANACWSDVSAAGAGSVCQWNGSNYQPHMIRSGGQIGKVDFGFTNFEACKSVTVADRFGFVCQWNGTNFQPYVSFTGEFVGRPDYGYNNVGDCTQATQSAGSGSVCQWDGVGYSAYPRYNPANAIASFGNDFQRCLSYTSNGGNPPPPPPPPRSQVLLLANGSTNLTVSAGQTITYNWETNDVQSVNSYYTADRGDQCSGGITNDDVARGLTKPWVVKVPNERNQVSAQVQDCQRGVTYTIVLSATTRSGQVQSASLRIRVL